MKVDKRLRSFKQRKPLNEFIDWNLHVKVFVKVTSDLPFELLVDVRRKFTEDMEGTGKYDW